MTGSEPGSFDVEHAALSLWGKSADLGSPRPHRLMQHLYDTLAVGELIWDEYLADPTRNALGAASDGRGRQFFAFLCGVHDVGKATPKFQSKSPELAARVCRAGLTWSKLSSDPKAWHHTKAGARILEVVTRSAGWSDEAADWVWPMVGGHHGSVPARGMIRPKPINDDHGRGDRWPAVQNWILERIAVAAGFGDVADAAPVRTPPVGVQLAISGSIIMADWLASDHSSFPPIDDPSAVSVEAARARARKAWFLLDLRTGISRRQLPDDLMMTRFGRDARPLQVAAARLAWAMPAPGLVIIEAAMGEGKTEAALVVAEILAQRFGLRGVFVGMPTQATSDPMFDRVHGWAAHAAPDAPIVLLHGKRMFNPRFTELRKGLRLGPIYEDETEYGSTGDQFGFAQREHSSAAVVDWFLGRKRGLLSPLGIGTIDNLLHAATRTPHVMLRHTGLAQKVVILDEVHAASVYMSQFLLESLRWLGSAGTPVVLLTATLPPSLRVAVASQYLAGAGVVAPELPTTGYPSMVAVGVNQGSAFMVAETTTAWREPQRVKVGLLGDRDDPDGAVIASRLKDLLAGGGTALVIRNTVDRAQQTYLQLEKCFPGEVELLHARITVGDRAVRTDRELHLLGPGGGGRRPRHVLVATQVAEQSFDVDADVLITDLAPIDLLLQRAGRIHRHDRGHRPAPVDTPSVLVTGMSLIDGAPEFPRGSMAIYGGFRLLRAAALVVAAAAGYGWEVPTDIPRLVAIGYGDEPTAAEAEWPEVMERARKAEDLARQKSRDDARRFLLATAAALPPDLEGLHYGEAGASDDQGLDAVVRDGEPSAEVVLIRRAANGAELTMSGRPLSWGGVLVDDDTVVAEALASIVRLPTGARARKSSLATAIAALPIPDAWQGHPYLRFLRPLVLDDDLIGEVGGSTFRYDHRLGLIATRP